MREVAWFDSLMIARTTGVACLPVSFFCIYFASCELFEYAFLIFFMLSVPFPLRSQQSFHALFCHAYRCRWTVEDS